MSQDRPHPPESKEKEEFTLPDGIKQLEKFADNTTTKDAVKNIILDIKKIMDLQEKYLLRSLQLKNDTVVTTDDIAAAINKFFNTLNDTIQKFSDKKNASFIDVLYNILLSLAKIAPFNDADPCSLDKFSTFEKADTKFIVYTSDRYRFDIRQLVKAINTTGKFINPFTNKHFVEKDIETLTRFAEKNGEKFIFTQKKREPSNPTQDDLAAFDRARANDLVPLTLGPPNLNMPMNYANINRTLGRSMLSPSHPTRLLQQAIYSNNPTIVTLLIQRTNPPPEPESTNAPRL